MSVNRKRAIILGAGPVGLITAWKLLENGWSVELYEKEAEVGGMCRTWKWGEFLVDSGPHIYHTPDKELVKFWEREFGDLFIKGDFWCKNVKGDDFNTYWDYPLSWESISRYPKELKEKVLQELEALTFENKARACSYKEYLEAQVGSTLYQMFYKKYPEKIWGISTDEMTPDWAPKRVEFRRKVTPFYHNQWNAAGKYGTGCIYERIKDKILDLGGSIYTNTEVDGIATKGNYITEIKLSNNKVVKADQEDIVISSLPITVMARFLGYESKLQFRGIRSVYLAYEQSEILPEGIHWLYYDSERVFFNRITEAKKLSPGFAPKDKTYLTAEITYSKDDEIDAMEENVLIQKIAEQVELVGLAQKKDLIAGSTHKEDYVYPVHQKGYQEELARTRAAISSYQQLYSLGTGGDFNYADSQILFHKAFDTVEVLCGKDSSCSQVIRQTPRVKLNSTISINGRKVGGGERACIIAEAGLNHNGSLRLAKNLVDEAKRVGCDAIKFQTFKASSRISKKIKAVKYAETIIGQEETLYDMFNRLAMSYDDQKELFAYAREKGIEIFSTPFDFEAVDFLESLGVSLYKIASMDAVNLPLIQYIAKTGKPIILSTGMSNLGQIEEAVETVTQAGNPNLMLLHCNSSYPAAPEEMNLKVIRRLKESFKVPVGLSDHTFGLFVAQTALALGADLIERHFTLDRTMEGPDHILSSGPQEFYELVEMSKKIPLILGDGVKRIQPNEYDTLNTQRKSLYAAQGIKLGQVITREMVAIKGPGGGLLPRYLDVVVGRKARMDIESDHPITWEVV
ncbi:MAG: FAD-dependent oxidoreductase [Candidatus Margulisiibacteriota bacterium]